LISKLSVSGSIVNIEGGTDADVKNRINKARVIFNILGKVWRARNISRDTKMKIFNSNVKSVLLYGAETWRTTKAMLKNIYFLLFNLLANSKYSLFAFSKM
jgi:hypothetical protein